MAKYQVLVRYSVLVEAENLEDALNDVYESVKRGDNLYPARDLDVLNISGKAQ